MENIFIQQIELKNVRNIDPMLLTLSHEVKKNLIITGRNGSGKTTFLKELRTFLEHVANGNFPQYLRYISEIERVQAHIKNLEKNDTNAPQLAELGNRLSNMIRWSENFGKTRIHFANEEALTKAFQEGRFILAHFDAKRNTALATPKGINKVTLQPIYSFSESPGQQFIQYMVNLKADRSFARDDNDINSVNKIDEWFTHFETHLLKLFSNNDLQLIFDRKNYNFNIIELEKEPYNLNQLSDGFSAILSIVTELIMRMENNHIKNYDLQGIVLIDEIEVHLHIDLQKKILPFLASFFPHIQFIVTTHSPFVLTSIEDAVICDLETKEVLSDLSSYSSEAIVESYFDSDKYSSSLKEKVAKYEELSLKLNPSEDDLSSLAQFETYFSDIPTFHADELQVKLQQIKMNKHKAV